MKKILPFFLLLCFSVSAQTVESLRTEYSENPLGMDVSHPRFSWELNSNVRSSRQTAYQVLVTDKEENLARNTGNIWNSGIVKSDQSTWIEYQGKPLESRKRYYWKVRVWNEKNKVVSQTAWFETGLFHKEDWQAHWIGMKGTEGKPPKSVELQKEFTLRKRVVKARIYVTGLGAYHLSFNGSKVGRDVLTPGWTNYLRTLHYQTYEIPAEEVTSGTNFITATLGNAWWSSGLGWGGGKFSYSQGPCRLLLQMELEFYDGSRQTLISDETWQARLSPIVSNTLYDGEVYDARLENSNNWVKANLLDDESNSTTLFGDKPGANKAEEADTFSTRGLTLKASPSPPVRITRELQPVAITEPRKGRYVLDFGQNLVGYVRLKAEGKTGKEVTMKFAELLTDKGLADQANLRSIRPTDKYIFKGYGTEEWEPRFTYHGFRYVEVEGLSQKPDLNTFTARVIHSDLPEAGGFSCSDDLLNRIYGITTWSLKGNLMDVPTDCPQRDERLGWMGDAQIFAPTAAYMMNMNGFFTKWQRDIADSQHSSGYVYDVNPKIVVGGPSKPAWGDAVVIVPYQMYRFYGDKRILEENYTAMQAWVEYMNNHPSTQKNRIYHFQTGEGEKAWYGYGDWVPVEASPSKPIGGAYQFYSNRLLSEIAGILKKKTDAEKYAEVARRTAERYNELYYDKNTGNYQGGTQAANLIPLSLGIATEKAKVADQVSKNVIEKGNHLSTGFIATQMLLPALSESGQHELAYTVATQRTYPSWGYMIDNGATTMWELWNSDKEKPEGMNSRNHFAYCSLGEWFYEYLAGIRRDPDSEGFKHFLLAPMPAGNLQWAEASYRSPYGKIHSRWDNTPQKFILKCSVPANSRAQVRLPLGGKSAPVIKESGKPVFDGKTASKTRVTGVTFVKREGDTAVLEVLSGEYIFTVEN